MDQHRSPLSRLSWAAILGVPALFLAAFFVYPVASITARGFSLGTVGDVVGDSHLRGVAWFSLWQAVASTALTIAIAMPAAYVFARYDFPGKAALRAFSTIPFVLPTVVVGAAFLTLLGPNGPLGIDLRNSIWAILIAHVFFNYAVVVRTVGGLWANLDQQQEDAARALGASKARTFLEVTLPRLAPAIAAAASIVFLFTFTSFGVVLILGGPQHTTLEVETYTQTTRFLNLDVAAVLALSQMAAVVGLLVAYRAVQRRYQHQQRLLPRRELTARPSTAGQRLVVAANVATMLVLLGTPLVVLIERSLSTPSGYALTYYRALDESRRGSTLFVSPLEATANSLTFALAATAIALIVGGLASIYLSYRRTRMAAAADTMLTLPLGTSAATIGFGFIIALDEPPLNLRASWWIVPIAHALIGVPFVIRILVPTMRAVEQRLREVAATLGAAPMRAFREVDLPIVFRAGAVAAGFAFAVSIGEFGATAFIVRPDRPTLPTAIFRFLGQPGDLNYGQAMAMSTILMAVTGLVVLAIERFRVGEVGEF